MSRGVSDKITYKPYNQAEQWLLPPSLDELVSQNHFFKDSKLKVFLKNVEEITHKENEVYGEKDLAELGEDITVTSEEIKEAAAKINKRLAQINDLEDEETKEVKKN